ncbi:unnamed protein product [Effrenium voratum]|nr:unnamed protein product [Effrenium voratum]
MWLGIRGQMAQCKLQHGAKWLNAVVVETLPDAKVRVHVPMDEAPEQELEVTSPKLKPTRIEALELKRHPCYPEGLHPVCFPRGFRGTLFDQPVRCSSDECMPGGCRGTASEDTKRIAYFCPRTAFLFCAECFEAPDLGQVTAETCRRDLRMLQNPDTRKSAVAARRILSVCNKSQQARILFLDAGICAAVAEAAGEVLKDFRFEDPSHINQALLRLLARLAEWLYLAAKPKRAKPCRVLVNSDTRLCPLEENSDAFSSAAQLYELFTGRSRQKEQEPEDQDDWREASVVEVEHQVVQVQLLSGNRISVPQAWISMGDGKDRPKMVSTTPPVSGGRMLPPALPRGPAPKGVRLERHPEVEELLVADADFAVGDLVLSEKFLLCGPPELPPLAMFRPPPPEVGTVEIAGDGFPSAVIFDQEHMKLLFEYQNSELEVQQEVLAMQDSMHPSSETYLSTWRVAEWLVAQQLPWLQDLDVESLARLLRLFCVNSHPCKAAGNTSGLLKWGTMINHSCLPNVVYSSVQGPEDFEGHFRACRPIAAGEVLGVSYMKLQGTLAPMNLRRRMLWYLKGFVCLCPRCSLEAAALDPARRLVCHGGLAAECEAMVWQYLPGSEQHRFACACRVESSADVEARERRAAHGALGALCARWTSASSARAALAELREEANFLHEDHFAVQGLRLLFLALEADEFLSGKRSEGGQDWLMKHALPRNDLFLAKRVLMDRADLTAADRQGNSVLAVAGNSDGEAVEHQCSQEMVELLLERGCRHLSPRSSKGPLGPPLAIAARCGRLEVVRVLLDYGCDPAEIEAGAFAWRAKRRGEM